MANKFQNSIFKKIKIKSAVEFGDFEFWNLFGFWPFLSFVISTQFSNQTNLK